MEENKKEQNGNVRPVNTNHSNNDYQRNKTFNQNSAVYKEVEALKKQNAQLAEIITNILKIVGIESDNISTLYAVLTEMKSQSSARQRCIDISTLLSNPNLKMFPKEIIEDAFGELSWRMNLMRECPKPAVTEQDEQEDKETKAK